MKDHDLDTLLSEYREQKVSELQLQKWKRAVTKEITSQKNKRRSRWLPLAAASVGGFVMGAMVFSSSPDKKELQLSSADATIEYVYIKNN